MTNDYSQITIDKSFKPSQFLLAAQFFASAIQERGFKKGHSVFSTEAGDVEGDHGVKTPLAVQWREVF